MNTQEYIPSDGLMVFSETGFQRLTTISNSSFNFYSTVDSSIIIPNKFAVDSSWETGNIFYIDSSDNTVKKMNYNGENSYSFQALYPTAISAIQSSAILSNDISTFSTIDEGCWFIDSGVSTIYKLDKNLISLGNITGFQSPTDIVSTPDKGCYVVDDSFFVIYKITKDITIEGFINYSSFDPVITEGSVKRIRSDKNNNLWILAGGYLYVVSYANGELEQLISKNVAVDLSVSNDLVKDFDLSRGNDNQEATAYVVGGCNNNTFIIKYDTNLSIIASQTGITNLSPVNILVPQYSGAQSFYVLGDINSNSGSCIDSSSSSSSEDSNEIYGTKIYKISNTTLNNISFSDLYMYNINGFIIPHVIDCTTDLSNLNVCKFSSELTFDITGLTNHVPQILEEEFVVVVRERVDFRANGAISSSIKSQGKDIGQFGYINKSPNTPIVLTQGFEELRKV